MDNYFKGVQKNYYICSNLLNLSCMVSLLILYDDAFFFHLPCSASAHFEDPPGDQEEGVRVDA